MSKKTFRFQLYPTAAQRDVLDGQLRICCELYNAALQERREAWRMARVSVRFAAQSAQLPAIKVERPDVAALDGALFKRAPAAQNDKVAIYEMKLSEVDQISEGMQRTFRRSPGFFAHDTLEAALQDLSEPPAAAAKAFTIDQGPVVKALLKLVKEEPVVAAISSLASSKNRYYRSATGIESSKWLAGHWKELAAGRPDMSVTTFKHAAFPQESVILTVRGTTEPDKVVVVGGHLDSTAGGSDSPAPGADDNASGIAVTEELIRVLAASGHKPAQTLKFIAYATEEAGLRGSGEIAAAFKKDGVAVQGQTILDPVSRGVSTMVRVKNGQPVVIGGMLSSIETKSVKKVPLLGYIPIIGWLFTSVSSRRTNTDLVIFVTPTILVD